MNAQGVAEAYEADLRQFFSRRGLGSGDFPRFDLILLGLGLDGHTASLFPDTLALRETQQWVVANWVEKLQSFRITLTFPVLNNAAEVVFLVAGSDKASIVARIFERTPGELSYPAQRVRPSSGNLRWMLDTAAASQLAPGQLGPASSASAPAPKTS